MWGRSQSGCRLPLVAYRPKISKLLRNSTSAFLVGLRNFNDLCLLSAVFSAFTVGRKVAPQTDCTSWVSQERKSKATVYCTWIQPCLLTLCSKRKLNQDPNNTKWSRNETTFGQKILRAHGWQPGQYLGAQDASHASMHSKASSAPIKITMKDDNLGLGAKVRQKQADECTGLDVFKDLLGRLNGESDESIAKKQAFRSEIKTSLWVERRFGPMRFVKGGLLVGDQITELINQQAANKASETTESSAENSDEAPEAKPEKKEKKSKKRKAEDVEENVDAETDSAEGKKKKKKRSKDEAADVDQDESSDAERKKRKKEKKEKKAKEAQADAEEDSAETKSKSKKEKKDKKKRKEAKSEEQSDESAELSKKEKKKKRKQQESEEDTVVASTTVTVSTTASGTSTPAGTGTSTPQPLSRHMVRSRNIASKRMAMADMAALQQVCSFRRSYSSVIMLTCIRFSWLSPCRGIIQIEHQDTLDNGSTFSVDSKQEHAGSWIYDPVFTRALRNNH